MPAELDQRLDHLEERIEAIYKSVKRSENYFKWTLIITIVMIVLPIIASLVLVPIILSSFSQIYTDIGLY